MSISNTSKTSTSKASTSKTSTSKKSTSKALAPIPVEKKDLACCTPEQSTSFTKHPKHGATKITVKYDCGFHNKLFIRGEGVDGLSWDKGILMNCTKNDEWSWETDKHFKNAKFKILLNDSEYECGENHTINCDKSLCVTPAFQK